MKLQALLVAMLMSSQAMAVQVFEKPVSDGMDKAILDSFREATASSAIDDTSKISLDEIKSAVSSLRINNDNFEISFDDGKLKNLLSSQGIASWNGLSDPVLVWLADVEESGINVINGDSDNEFAVALNQASNKNNYNLMFPVMDLDDVEKVNAQTILSHSDKILATASKRYDAKYFVAGAIEKNSGDNTYTVKWNAYDDEGKSLGNGQTQGTLEETSTAMSRDVAKVLMQNISSDTATAQNTSSDEVESMTTTDPDGGIVLGPVKGGVRVMFTGVDNVSDYPKINKILISYGYESDISVLGYNSQGVIFLIPTGSSPSILDGTLAHAGEFTKVGDWIYKFNKSSGVASAGNGVGTVTRTTTNRVTSNMNGYGGEAYTKKTVKRTVEVTTKIEPPAQDGAPVINLTDDSEGTDALEDGGINITQ